MQSTATLNLVKMTGNAGKIMRQLAAISASPEQQDRINITYSIDAEAVSITFDPTDLRTFQNGVCL